jgi:hypothetical protein
MLGVPVKIRIEDIQRASLGRYRNTHLLRRRNTSQKLIHAVSVFLLSAPFKNQFSNLYFDTGAGINL